MNALEIGKLELGADLPAGWVGLFGWITNLNGREIYAGVEEARIGAVGRQGNGFRSEVRSLGTEHQIES